MGASLLGAGGGGDPYIGKLMAIGAVRECGEVTLISPEEVPDDALIMPIAMMGAPTVLCEKGIGGTEYKRIFEMVERYFGRKVYATMPMEAGGVNSMLPIAAAARLGLPMVDCDGMGRAFPELQMVTFTIGGVSATPMALTDEKGNSVIFETITNQWTEELARSVTMSCGGSVTCSLYVMDGKTVKAYSVHDIVTRSEQLGKAIRNVKNATEGTPEESFLAFSEGIRLFKGKISDVLRTTDGKFNFGRVQLEGIGDYKGHHGEVTFQNENLCASVDGKILATAPDLICLVDTETFIPVTTDGLKYGKRVLVVDADPQGNTSSGLGVRVKEKTPTVYEVMAGETPIEQALCKTAVKGLMVLPADIRLAGAEIELANMEHRERVVADMLEGVRDRFDYIFIDCPPSLGMITLNALCAADGVLIPIQCEYFALEGVSALMGTVQKVQKMNRHLAIEGVVLTMLDARTNLGVQVAQEVRKVFKNKVYQTVIPRNVRLGEAPSHGLPISLYDPRSLGAQSYQQLAKEFLARE